MKESIAHKSEHADIKTYEPNKTINMVHIFCFCCSLLIDEVDRRIKCTAKTMRQDMQSNNKNDSLPAEKGRSYLHVIMRKKHVEM